ncbi:MAG: MBL fold metallo-hydrolase RNA specificity domain-containing protein [Promethearchaeota archaeon]
MTSIQIFDGNNTIGGNKIYIEENGGGLFLDFGMNFKKYGEFFQEYISPRIIRGIYDLFRLNLIPKLKIYRKDIIPSDIDVSSFSTLNVNAVLLSHAHMDHFGNIGLLNPDYPLVASPYTLALLKGMLDVSGMKLGTDVAYFSNRELKGDGRVLKSKGNILFSRDFICTEDYSDSLHDFLELSVKSRSVLQEGNLITLNTFSSNFEIAAFEVDHSIYGATAYLLSGDNTIAYTGDFRLHGKKGKMSEKFINQAKNASILIIEGTRTAREDIQESEEEVYENCLNAAVDSKGLVIADFSARNFERMETFKKIAKEVNRTLVITAKDAYLLNALRKVDGIERIKDITVYKELKTSTRYWEDKFLVDDVEINYIDPNMISKDPNNYILCFSFFDIKNLLDIKLKGGTYIYSSSEAFEEESEYPFIRLYNWLNFFNFNIVGFDVVEEDIRIKPQFMKGYHASGHVSKSDLIKVIDTIDPDILIPVHTDYPEWFSETFDNAVLLKDYEIYPV